MIALHVSGIIITHLQEHKTTVTTASGNYHHHHHHHYHMSVMKLGHLLTRSGLTYPEVSSKVCHDSYLVTITP